MFFCDSNSFVFVHAGQVGLSTCSIPSLLAVPLYLSVCGWLTLRDRLLGWRDAALLLGLVAVVCWVGMAQPLKDGGYGVAGFTLIWPFLVFMAGYGIWRLAGGAPLRRWPWYRFGLLATLTVLLADLAKAFLDAPPAHSNVWVIGGAGLRDALVMGPPVLVAIFFGLLDCRSPLVFCSRKCRDQNRCRFRLDGKNPSSPEPPEVTVPQGRSAWWKRVFLGLLCAIAVLAAYTALPFSVPTALPSGSDKQGLAEVALAEGDRIARIYGIPTPHISLLQSPVAGLTKPPSSPGQPSAIELGSPVQSFRFSEDLDLLRAVVAHEMGHAVQHARGEAFPTVLVFVLYVMSLAALPAVLPTWRGRLVWLVASLTALALLSGIPVLKLPAHAAIRWLLVLQALPLLLMLAPRTRRVMLLLLAKAGGHLPGVRALATGAIGGIALFFAMGAWFGSLNAARELMADKVAACEVGVGEIREALSLVYGASSGTSSGAGAILFDPFHPSRTERDLELARLEGSPELKRLCDSLRSSPRDLRGPHAE